jgi:hypothetical protein
MNTTESLIKAFSDAIPLGPHPEPYNEWIQVRLDFIQEAINHFDWIERGNSEWRDMAVSRAKQASSASATARVAITHLQTVLNKARTHAEQQAADTAARDWLTSIGSEPT